MPSALGVEAPGLVLAAARAGDLHVVEPHAGVRAAAKIRRKGSTTPCSCGGYAARSRRLELLGRSGSSRSVGQRLQHRSGAGGGDPGEDGVLALQDVEVGRLPGIDRAAEVGEGAEVDLGAVAAGRGAGHGCARRTPARPRARAGSCGWARRSCPAPGRRASRPASTALDEAGQQVEVVGHPLQGGVGDEHVDRARVGRPVAEVGDLEVDAGDGPSRAFAIISGLLSRPRDLGVRATGRPAAGSGCRVRSRGRRRSAAGPAPIRGDQVDERPAALVGVRQVAVGIPAGRHAIYLDVKIP